MVIRFLIFSICFDFVDLDFFGFRVRGEVIRLLFGSFRVQYFVYFWFCILVEINGGWNVF